MHCVEAEGHLWPRSPLGRGMLTGTLTMDSLADKDFRRRMPRFQGAAGEKARRPNARPVFEAWRLLIAAM